MHDRVIWAGVLFIAFLTCCFLALMTGAWAQHNHAQHHPTYQDWASKKTGNCCNNDDCGVLFQEDVRETNTGTEVNVIGTWCPVKQEHFIIKGKSPDWNSPHACINRNLSYQGEVCGRLLCYAGRGGI